MVWVDHTDERLTASTADARHAWAGRLLTYALSLYLAVSIALVIVVRAYGERWWPATVLMFGPRWVWALPMLVLAPLASLPGRRGVNSLLAVISLVVVGKLFLGFCVPWRVWISGRAAPAIAEGKPFHLRVMTCNVHAAALDEPAASRLIDQLQPDVVAFEEWFGTHPARLGHPPAGARWHVLQQGELRLQSRYPIRHGPVLFDHGWGGGAAAEYILKTPAGDVPLFVLHLASPHNAISSAVRLHPNGETRLQGNSWVRSAQGGSLYDFAARAGPGVLLMGDFNMPGDSALFRNELSDFTDAFETAGWGFGWTYFARSTAVRIDHVLAGRAWRIDRCRVGAFVGSPHRPVIADLTLLGTPAPATQP